jgi:hypothetical protein
MVGEAHKPGGRQLGGAEREADLSAAVAYATLGRPSSATLTTEPGAWTKSIVIASGLDGAESVVVSPVRRARISSRGRSACLVSNLEWTRFP